MFPGPLRSGVRDMVFWGVFVRPRWPEQGSDQRLPTSCRTVGLVVENQVTNAYRSFSECRRMTLWFALGQFVLSLRRKTGISKALRLGNDWMDL